MSPIQQMFLGVGPSGDSYWWQKCDQTDSALSAYTGWSGNCAAVIVDDDENSYFLAQSQTSRTCVFGFDKDGANIVKSYGADWVNSGTSIPTNKKFQATAQSGFIFDNKLYMAGMGVNTINGDASSSVVSILNIPSGQAASGYARHSFMVSGQSKNHYPNFLVGRVGSGLTHSVSFSSASTYLSFADSSDFDFGSTFTFEAWVKPEFHSGYNHLLFEHQSFQISVTNTGRLVFDLNHIHIGGDLWSSEGSVIEDQWNHVAVVGDSGTLKIYINGVNDQNTNRTGVNITGDTGTATISSPTGYYFKGEISNYRIVKGTAVYTANFAPSVEPLTNITNTVLLCCNGNSATSSTVTPGTITANGSPTVAQDCPLSSSYLCGGGLINAALSPNTTRCPMFFKSSVELNVANYGSADIIYAKREDPNSTYFTSGTYEDAAITSDGLYAYLAGTCGSNTSQGGGGNTSGGSWGGTTDAYLLKINYLTGALITRSCIPSVGAPSGISMFYSIVIDSSGNIYCGGRCRQGWSGYMAFVIKFNSSMVIQWQKTIPNIGYIQHLAIDSSDNVYAVATSTTSGYKAGWIMKITSSGTIDWSTKITIGSFTDRYPFLKGLTIKGENDNLYLSFVYNINPSSNSPTTTYHQLFACIKYPNTGDITGTYGDLVFTSGSLSTSNATMGTRTGDYVDTDERQTLIYKYDNTLYGNGDPTITTTSL